MKNTLRSAIASLAIFTVLLLPLTVCAQRVEVHDIIVKMTKELNLTDEQAKAVEPIITKSLAKRVDIMEKEGGDLSIGKKDLKAAMLRLRDQEDKDLSKVLSVQQMKKLIDKRQFRESLNKGNIDFSEGFDSTSMSIQGPKMSF